MQRNTDPELSADTFAPGVRPRAVMLAGAVLLAIGAAWAGEYLLAPAVGAQSAAAVQAVDRFAGISLVGTAAVVVDITDGEVLYEMNPEAQLPLASLTKIALALAAAEVLRPEDIITIPFDIAPTGSSDPVRRGEQWRFDDFLDYTLIASSNDGASAIAAIADPLVHERYPDSPESGATLWRMNALAQELSLSQTYFLNVSGLDLSATQSGSYGSARDMAKLFAYAASAQPALFARTAKSGRVLSSVGGSSAAVANTNEAQGSIPGLILGKTGFTDLAGGNLAVVFDVGLARPVVAVVLSSTRDDRFTDMQRLVAAARDAIGDK